MLRVLQWVYDLGVEHERTRVARLLEQARNNNYAYMETSMSMLADPDIRMSKSRQEKLKFRVELTEAVNGIINEITRYDEQYVIKGSPLFPEEK